jgi:hypothetical protein
MTKDEYEQEYDRLFKWRERWTRLAHKHEAGRLQTRQEAIERRALIADNRIRALMRAYDKEYGAADCSNVKEWNEAEWRALIKPLVLRMHVEGVKVVKLESAR